VLTAGDLDEFECLLLLRALLMFLACCGSLFSGAPAINHIHVKRPIRTHAKAWELVCAEEAVNRGRMHAKVLGELFYGQNRRRGRRNAGLLWIYIFHDPL
jgi:hypothetical protein